MSRRPAPAAKVVRDHDEAIALCTDARPRTGAYGVFEDLYGNHRDLIERVDG